MTAYETLPGRSRENARIALNKAVKNGFAEEDVLTQRDGYLIPIKDEADKKSSAPAEAPAKPARKRASSKKE